MSPTPFFDPILPRELRGSSGRGGEVAAVAVTPIRVVTHGADGRAGGVRFEYCTAAPNELPVSMQGGEGIIQTKRA